MPSARGSAAAARRAGARGRRGLTEPGSDLDARAVAALEAEDEAEEAAAQEDGVSEKRPLLPDAADSAACASDDGEEDFVHGDESPRRRDRSSRSLGCRFCCNAVALALLLLLLATLGAQLLDVLAAPALEAGRREGYVEQCDVHLPVQVFSDIDDTFKSSGGIAPAGCDALYGRNVIYPGVAQFFAELSRGTSDKSSAAVLRPALLSARPELLRFALKISGDGVEARAMSPELPRGPADDEVNAEGRLENVDHLQAFDYQTDGIEKLLNARHNLSSRGGGVFGLNADGSMYGGIDLTYDSMGKSKMKSFLRFFRTAHDAERVCVTFVGDNGQGDCTPAAQGMRHYVKEAGGDAADASADADEAVESDATLGLRAAFIHRLPCSRRTCNVENDTTSAPVFLFDTYLDAASIARDKGLISLQGYIRVARAVRRFFSAHCSPSGRSASLLVTDAGCEQLRSSIATHAGSLDAARGAGGARQRYDVFCATCCADGGQAAEYKYLGVRWQCANPYAAASRSWVAFLTPRGAREADCHALCASGSLL
eukprot:TRINITY_DN47861_c0_g1_i1.p1 TRINITY_DN47861_c0_g1~~TRINITY_DN47861_c0_g1_i1.p1  ORF type:complete len:542 (-),score=122.59 TRINITY_DN47861_c0_g1_i1:55-1680(-)